MKLFLFEKKIKGNLKKRCDWDKAPHDLTLVKIELQITLQTYHLFLNTKLRYPKSSPYNLYLDVSFVRNPDTHTCLYKPNRLF